MKNITLSECQKLEIVEPNSYLATSDSINHVEKEGARDQTKFPEVLSVMHSYARSVSLKHWTYPYEILNWNFAPTPNVASASCLQLLLSQLYLGDI